MILVEDMKDLKIYKRNFWIPFDEDNKKQGALIYLLTPNYESSRKLINLPYMKNSKLFTSYYMEKNVALYIKEGSYEVIESDDYIHGLNENRIEQLLGLEETKLTKDERQELPNRFFGLPDQKQYPMPDESHVITAIRFFNKVSKENEAELARNIIKRIKKFKMETQIHVGKGNRFYKYWSNSKLSHLKESEILLDELYDKFYNVMYENTSIEKFHNSLNTIISCYPEDTELILKYLKGDLDTSSYYTDSEHSQEHRDYLTSLLPESLNEAVEIRSESYIEIIEDKPTQDGEIDPNTGIWNSRIRINDKNYRERVEALIFNGDQLFVAPKGTKLRLPGGSTEPDKSFETQLQNECREEARINICNIKYADMQTDDYGNREVPSWQKALSFTYDGCITRIFTAEYYSEYKGEINEHDKDNDMLKHGKFVDVNTKILKALGPIRARVVTNYLKRYKDKKSKGNISEVTTSSDQINESYLNCAPWLKNYKEGTTTLYLDENQKVLGSYYYTGNILKGIDINPDANLLEMTELLQKDIQNMLMPNINEAILENTPLKTIAALETYGWDITKSEGNKYYMQYNGQEVLNEAAKSLGTSNAVIMDDKKRYLVCKYTIDKKFGFPGVTRVDGEDEFLSLKGFLRNNFAIEIVDGKLLNPVTEEDHLYGISNWSVIKRGANRAYQPSWVTEKELLEIPYKSRELKRFIALLLAKDNRYRLDPKKYEMRETDYYGYKIDILEMRNAFSKTNVKDAYKYLKLPKPDDYTLSIFVCNNSDMLDHFDDDSITVASRNLYESLSKSEGVSYELYLKGLLYAHCIRHTFGDIGTGLIVPFAEYKAGIEREISGNMAEKEIKNMHYKFDTTSTFRRFDIDDKKASMMRAYKGIEYEYGIETIYKIFRTKDMNRLLGYMTHYGIHENADITKNINTIFNDSKKFIRKREDRPNLYLREDFTLMNLNESHISDGKVIILFEELMNDKLKDTKLKQALYKDRIKKNTEVFNIFNRVKADCPMIKYTYIDVKRYNKRNLFVDLSYYNEVYFKNTMYESRRGMELYTTLLKRLISDTKFKEAGYKKKTIFIPVLDWDIDPNTKMWLYKETINPISIIYEMMRKNPLKLKQIFGDTDLIFCGKYNYFKINFNNEKSRNDFRLFLRQLTRLRQAGISDTAIADEDTETPENSPKGITMDIVDKLEKSQNIEITRLNFSGNEEKISAEEFEKKKKGISSNTDQLVSNADKEKTAKEEMKKDRLVAAINKSAQNAADSEEALEKMDNDFVKDLITDLASDAEETVNINAARASRIVQLNNDLLNKEIKGRKISEILADDEKKKEKEQKPVALPIASTNEDWKNLKFINFDKDYNQDRYIIMMLEAMSNYQYPISIVNIDAEDTSNSEDYIDTYTANLEDYKGKRFTIKFDVPKMINAKYLKLRGNKKTMNIQNFLMPIIKTDPNRVQLISNYNKIMLERFGSTKGKSFLITDRINKTISKLTAKNTKQIKGVKIVYGDNSKIAERYELPLDYIDASSIFTRIETEKVIFYFNQDELYKLRDIDESKGLPFAIEKKNGSISSSRSDSDVYYYTPNEKEKFDTFSFVLNAFLIDHIPGYEEMFSSVKGTTKYVYTRASISDTKIPLIIVCCLLEGLTKVLTKANIQFDMVEKLDKNIRSDYTKDYIKFEDGYLVFTNTYDASLLLNGLKACDTEGYSINNVNSRQMFIDFLDDFGGRLKLDSLDNFKDLMIDPITLDVLKEYKLPTEYLDMLLYGNALLADNKYVKHTHMIGRRMRRNELIPAYFYKALASAYWNYANENRHSRNNVTLQMKKSAVIDAIMADPTFADKSILNALEDIEDANSISTKGLSGMNTEGSYSLDKRTFDESMLNIMGMSTGFAGNVGITRQATIDMSLQGDKGYVAPIKKGDTSKMSDIKTLTMTEAITPYGSTGDDPFRTAMTFIQTAKHFVRTEKSDPCLVTNGADEAMPYMTTDIFAFKAKSEGTIIELVPNEYLIVAYKNGTKEMVNLSTTIEKNSDGGFYVPLKLDTDLKKGSKVKENDILAYDKLSFSNSCGEDDNLAYNIGPLTKVAILNTDEGFNDSAIVTEKLTQDCATEIVMPIEVMLTKDTEVFDMCKVGDHIEEGDKLLTIQNSYDDEDANDLIRLLNNEDGDMEISDLGKITKKASVTGVITGIKIYRTCEIEEMSDTLKKIVSNYEKDIKAKRKVMEANGISTVDLPPSYKLPPTGKMKNKEDSVLIVIYQKFRDVLAVGDKIVYYSANKGVLKDIIPKGEEPITKFRPNEEISSLVGMSSLNGRMVTSTLKIAAANKLMVELDRTCKDMAGIPYDDSKI